MFFPFFDLPWWGFVLLTLGLTHLTIISVTVFLHRHQAHRALSLHPLVSHVFRCWLWLTSGMVTRQWVAIHRKHHAQCDRPDDPHSPLIYGIGRVLLTGAELYRVEARNPETLSRYGSGTPDDWLERHLYARHPGLGIGLLAIAEVLLFGPLGLTVWAIQMAWNPVFAAGVINGLGHWWGYRSFATADASRNIVPWGIFIGGEELHNNHHAYSASARLSSRRWEFDIGWMYIRLLEILRLARVRTVSGQLRVKRGKTACDDETLHAIVRHRFAVLADYASSLRRTVRRELHELRALPGLDVASTAAALRHWLQRETSDLPVREQHALELALRDSAVLRTICTMRQELAAVWKRSPATPEQLVRQLEDWCQRAEASGIAALQQFSRHLRSYA